MGEKIEIISKSYLSLFSTAPAKIKILSTAQTIPEQKLEDRLLKDYPVIVKDYPDIERLFIDSVIINNSYTAALGADYD